VELGGKFHLQAIGRNGLVDGHGFVLDPTAKVGLGIHPGIAHRKPQAPEFPKSGTLIDLEHLLFGQPYLLSDREEILIGIQHYPMLGRFRIVLNHPKIQDPAGRRRVTGDGATAHLRNHPFPAIENPARDQDVRGIGQLIEKVYF